MVETGEAGGPASRVVLRSEGRRVGSTNKNLTLAFRIRGCVGIQPGGDANRASEGSPLTGDEMRGHYGAADVHRSQTRSQVLRTYQGSGGDAEPHRGSEGVLRPVPDGRRAGRRTAERRPAGRVPVGVSDQGFFQHVRAAFRQLRIRAAEIRRRRGAASAA